MRSSATLFARLVSFVDSLLVFNLQPLLRRTRRSAIRFLNAASCLCRCVAGKLISERANKYGFEMIMSELPRDIGQSIDQRAENKRFAMKGRGTTIDTCFSLYDNCSITFTTTFYGRSLICRSVTRRKVIPGRETDFLILPRCILLLR